MEENKQKEEKNQQAQISQPVEGTKVDTERSTETEIVESASSVWWKDKASIGLFIAGVLLVITGAFYFATRKARQSYTNKTVENKAVISPTASPQATGAAAVPTVSDDTSLETIEKEIESLQVEGLDQGDPSIESELQNL